MTDKLAVIILDALDDYNTKQLGMKHIDNLIRENNSEVLGVSSLPYTAQSNPLIWANYENKDKFWVETGAGEDQWDFPAGAFDREAEQAVGNAEGTWSREDFDTTFIWDDLMHQGVDVSALHIPIVLPPYSYNPLDGFDMGDHWFPHDAEQIEAHAEEMPATIKKHARGGKNFIATSVQIPDKPLHAMGENTSDKKEAERIGSQFDDNMMELIEFLEQEGYDWLIFGDHGSPWPGNIKIPEAQKFVPNHRKNSVIISNRDDWQLPTYTDELHDFMKEKVDVEKARPGEEEQEKLEEEALDVLKDYAPRSNTLFMFTGGKEALVVSHMLQEKVNADVPYGVIDTGNHFDEIYEFRNQYAEEHGIDFVKTSYSELLENVILKEDDPRGYHGSWDDSKELPEDLGGVAAQNASKEEWTVEASCGALKVHGVKKFIDMGKDVLITGQRQDDITVKDDAGLVNERENPEKHFRVNPLANWSKENVWGYIDNHDLDYPVLYNRGYDHTDAKCCTQKPNDIGEYGQQGVDVETEQAKDKLKQLGYI